MQPGCSRSRAYLVEASACARILTTEITESTEEEEGEDDFDQDNESESGMRRLKDL
jgi:hypothetical protein